jgi:uncharacterized integral membrane protein (TIGR00697 family)
MVPQALKQEGMEALLQTLQSWAPEWMWVGLLFFSFGSVLLLLRVFGSLGLYLYIGVAMIGANLHVLKVVQFSVFPDPVALGTILFVSTFLATDILAEYYGPRMARKAVLVGFSAVILFTLFMLFALAFRPLDPAEVHPDWSWAVDLHGHLTGIFTPIPALVASGLIAYLISQYHDIWIYQLIRRLTGGRYLWLRNNLSTAISSLIDNIIFSVLAWIVLAPDPLPWKVVVVTYILGTYVLKLVVAVLDSPVLYAARYALPPDDRAAYEKRP